MKKERGVLARLFNPERFFYITFRYVDDTGGNTTGSAAITTIGFLNSKELIEDIRKTNELDKEIDVIFDYKELTKKDFKEFVRK